MQGWRFLVLTSVSYKLSLPLWAIGYPVFVGCVDASAITLQVICGPVAEMYAVCLIYMYQVIYLFPKKKYEVFFIGASKSTLPCPLAELTRVHQFIFSYSELEFRVVRRKFCYYLHPLILHKFMDSHEEPRTRL